MVMRQDGSRLHAVFSGVYDESSARNDRNDRGSWKIKRLFAPRTIESKSEDK